MEPKVDSKRVAEALGAVPVGDPSSRPLDIIDVRERLLEQVRKGKDRVLPVMGSQDGKGSRCAYCGNTVQLDVENQEVTHPEPLCWYWGEKLGLTEPKITFGELLDKVYAPAPGL